MRRTQLARAAGALLAALTCACTEIAAGEATVNSDYYGNCTSLHQLYKQDNNVTRYIRLFGTNRRLTVMWGAHAPVRAAAALLVTALRHRLGYRDVTLSPGERTLCDLTFPQFGTNDRTYDKLVVHVGAESMKGAKECTWQAPCEFCPWGTRLEMVGRSGAAVSLPVAMRLHVMLAETAWGDPACSGADTWLFYANRSVLAHCRFLTLAELPADLLNQTEMQAEECSSLASFVPVLAPKTASTARMELAARASAAHLPLFLVPLANDTPRAYLRDMQRRGNVSLLFLDYDLWGEDGNATRVRTVQPPPCVPPPSCVQLPLRAVLSEAAISDPACFDADSWTFYSNASAVSQCGFLQLPDLQLDSDIELLKCLKAAKRSCVPVLVPADAMHSQQSFATRAQTAALPLCLVPVPSGVLRALVNNTHRYGNHSLLFLDYDEWCAGANSGACAGNDISPSKTTTARVHLVTPPPCPKAACSSALDTASALRVADAYMLRSYAPLMYDVISNLAPRPAQLRQVLDLEADGRDPEEAACAWAHRNRNEFEKWSHISKQVFGVIVLFCRDDPDKDQYFNMFYDINSAISDKLPRLLLKVMGADMDCSDETDLNQRIFKATIDLRWQRLLGVVAPGAGAVLAAEGARNMEVQLVLYEAPPTAAHLSHAAHVAVGRLQALARAFHHFVVTNGWHRLAVISDSMSDSHDYIKELCTEDLACREELLQKVTSETALDALTRLLDANARIFFVNTVAVDARTVLCEASKRRLTRSAGFVWLVREWSLKGNACGEDVGFFTLSYGWRGGNDSALSNGTSEAALRRKLNSIWKQAWPRLAAPMADAVLLLVHRMAATLKYNPSLLYDLHGDKSSSEISKASGMAPPVLGITQPLRQERHALAEPLVFVYAWARGQHDLLAVWRMRGGKVTVVEERRQAYEGERPWDGTATCAVRAQARDRFQPNCLDWPVFGAAAVVLLSIVALCVRILIVNINSLVRLATLVVWQVARRTRLQRMRQRERDVHLRLLTRCERSAAALSALLVDRAQLQLCEELGAGHFGHVRLGLLRAPHRAPMSVAAKALRRDAAPADEAEFLREACMLAALAHAHVVRLVGVCAADGPPLLLMEHAFFGDLLRYLRERRHLAEVAPSAVSEMGNVGAGEAEAAFVAPAQLTRLVREAAAALAYLETCRVVHRDVRAANCLVDARRSLKLADFGMARKTNASPAEEVGDTSTADGYKYLCRRRGVFPVRWMAPESLQQGVFSSASDVWALGVLALETATLGARPFGAWRSPRVLRYVSDGGRPPLPCDVNHHTCELTKMCWHRNPEARASAARVRDYLAAHPAALQPALLPVQPGPALAPDDHEPATADSGIGERDPEVEWGLPADPHVSTL